MSSFRPLLPAVLLLAVPAMAGDPPAATASLPAITLRQALARSLERSPELKSSSWDIRAAEARVLQSAFKPNPELSFEVQDPTGSGELSNGRLMEQTLRFSQLIERGGKRQARVAEARGERAVAAWDREVKRIEVMKDTTLAVIDVLAAQQMLKLAQETVKLLGQAVEVASNRVQAARAQGVEAVRARVAQQSAMIEVEHAEHNLAAARAGLALQWGGTRIDFGEVRGDLTIQPAVPSMAELRARLARNPGLARWQAVREAREAGVRLQKAQAVPDVTVFGGPRALGTWDNVGGVAGVSIPLPWHHRNEGNIAQAEALAARALDEKRAAEARATAALATAYEELLRGSHEAAILQDQLLPQAESAVDQLTASYNTGRGTQLEVLDARRTLIAARQQHLLALTACHKALATIEALTTGPSQIPSPAASK